MHRLLNKLWSLIHFVSFNMVEKNSGVPPIAEVSAPVHQPEQSETVADVGVAQTQVKRSRKSKNKQDPEHETVPSKDTVNAEQ